MPIRATTPANTAAPGAPTSAASTALILAAARVSAQACQQVRPSAGGHALPAIGSAWWMPVAVHDTAELLRQTRGAQVVVHAISPAYTDKAWRAETPALLDAIGATQAL